MAPPCNLVRICAYLLGEFGHLVANEPGMGAQAQFSALHKEWGARSHARAATHRVTRRHSPRRDTSRNAMRRCSARCVARRLVGSGLTGRSAPLPDSRRPSRTRPDSAHSSPAPSIRTIRLSPLRRAGASDLPTRALLLSSYVKLGHIYPELQTAVAGVFATCRSALDQEVQQVGARELRPLTRSPH